MARTRFVWNAEVAGRLNSAFNARLGDVTYYVASRDYGFPAYVEVRGSGSLKRLDLGFYAKIEQAKQACERHYAAGCDLSEARTMTDR
jgi:hypothetical protein